MLSETLEEKDKEKNVDIPVIYMYSSSTVILNGSVILIIQC